MFCIACGQTLPELARFCCSCGIAILVSQDSSVSGSGNKEPSEKVASSAAVWHFNPTANPTFREKLLECYLSISTIKELQEWLKDLGQDSQGTREEKIARIRQHTQYLSMLPTEFPDQTIKYLRHLSSGDGLSLIAQAIGVECEGTGTLLFKRIYRELGFQEAWLPRLYGSIPFNKETVKPFVQWYPILKDKKYEKDYYEEFYDEMTDIFGMEKVHEQYAVAHGKTLKIDFHIGHPQETGVGVEFKMPNGQGDLQRALGQFDDYITRYGSNLIVVLLPNFMTETEIIMFSDKLKAKNVDCIVKNKAA